VTNLIILNLNCCPRRVRLIGIVPLIAIGFVVVIFILAMAVGFWAEFRR
jgi:ABC-type lipoprotein release transport system permease subunit